MMLLGYGRRGVAVVNNKYPMKCSVLFSTTRPATSHSDQNHHHVHHTLVDPGRQRWKLDSRSELSEYRARLATASL